MRTNSSAASQTREKRGGLAEALGPSPWLPSRFPHKCFPYRSLGAKACQYLQPLNSPLTVLTLIHKRGLGQDTQGLGIRPRHPARLFSALSFRDNLSCCHQTTEQLRRELKGRRAGAPLPRNKNSAHLCFKRQKVRPESESVNTLGPEGLFLWPQSSCMGLPSAAPQPAPGSTGWC